MVLIPYLCNSEEEIVYALNEGALPIMPPSWGIGANSLVYTVRIGPLLNNASLSPLDVFNEVIQDYRVSLTVFSVIVENTLIGWGLFTEKESQLIRDQK